MVLVYLNLHVLGLSPMGVLLSGGLVHDWLYKYESLNLGGKKGHTEKKTQKYADDCLEIFALTLMDLK